MAAIHPTLHQPRIGARSCDYAAVDASHDRHGIVGFAARPVKLVSIAAAPALEVGCRSRDSLLAGRRGRGALSDRTNHALKTFRKENHTDRDSPTLLRQPHQTLVTKASLNRSSIGGSSSIPLLKSARPLLEQASGFGPKPSEWIRNVECAHVTLLEHEPCVVNALTGTVQASGLWGEKALALLKRAQQAHPRIFASVTLLLLTSYLTGSPVASSNVQLTILALGVAILGVPHGALDLVTAQGLMQEHRWPWPRRLDLTVFVAAYTACTALVVFLWCHFPGVSLAGLLAASAWHFGTNDAQGLLPTHWHWVEVAARGLGPITLPFILHNRETTLLFSHLAPPPAATHVAQLCTVLAYPTAAVVAITSFFCFYKAHQESLTQSRETNRTGRVGRMSMTSSEAPLGEWGRPELDRDAQLSSGWEMALLGLGCTLAPPLLGFFLAFCTLHSLRHTLAFFAEDHTPASLADLRYVGKAAGSVTVVTLLVALAIFAGLLKHPVIASHVAALQMASVQVIFVGLAALTAPHMVLLEVSRHHRNRKSARALAG